VEPDRVEAFRKKFNLRGHTLVAVVGRIKKERKGQETFLQAAALVGPRHPDVRFLLIGSPFPGNEAHLQAMIDLVRALELQQEVVFTGDVEDIKAAISALDVLVLPSGQLEPFSGTVLEGMAFSKPVIGTRIGGTVEQVEDGVTGLLVPPGDPTGMAEAMCRLVDSPALRERMGKAGRKRFLEKFEFEPFYANLLGLYREVSGG
jgi:glycosyltransferase involved in cell wall biosynthesis